MLLNTPEVITPQQTRRPGWPEILVGVAVMALLCYALPFGLGAVGVTDSWSDTTFGLFVAALSGVAGLAAFWLLLACATWTGATSGFVPPPSAGSSSVSPAVWLPWSWLVLPL